VDDLLNIGLSNALAATLLALVALAVGSIYRRPALVHGLWLLVLLKLVTPPLVRIPVAWDAPSESPALEVNNDLPTPETILFSPELTAGAPAPNPAFVPVAVEEELSALAPAAPAFSGAPLWPRLLPLVWLGGSLAWFALACVRLFRFRRLLRYVRPSPAALQERARCLARSLGMTRCPAVGLLPGRLAPMLWAVGGAPRLLLPADLLDRLDDEHFDTLLVHELAHLRRRDHWVRALEFAVMGLYWWHPVVWYARRELREAEEQCCDAWVVSTLPGAGRTYAAALMDTLDFLSTAPAAVPPLASGLGQVSDLKRRLTMILRGTTPRALSWPGCFAVLALGTMFLPLLPSLCAEPPKTKAPIETTIPVTITQQVDEQVRNVDLEQAKAKLAQAEADLRAKMAQVQQAKAALDEAAARVQNAQQQRTAVLRFRLTDEVKKAKEQPRRATPDRDQAAPGGDYPMVRIEILVSADDFSPEVLRNLRKNLSSVLPDKKLRITIHAPASDSPVAPTNRRLPTRYPGARPGQPDVPPPDANLVSPSPGVSRVSPSPAVGPRDKRIDELEKKLEKVLHELHELRKQMKGPPAAPLGS